MLAKAQNLKFVDITTREEVRGIEIQVSEVKEVKKEKYGDLRKN